MISEQKCKDLAFANKATISTIFLKRGNADNICTLMYEINFVQSFQKYWRILFCKSSNNVNCEKSFELYVLLLSFYYVSSIFNYRSPTGWSWTWSEPWFEKTKPFLSKYRKTLLVVQHIKCGFEMSLQATWVTSRCGNQRKKATSVHANFTRWCTNYLLQLLLIII